MTRLEDELRATFAARVTAMPDLHDVAGTAITRGRRMRRRQRVTVSAAFAVVVALVASGTWWVRGGGFDGRPDQRRTGQLAAPASRPAGSTPHLDLVVGGELRPAGRAPITLPGSGAVYDALRVPDGWLVVRGDKATHQLWLVGDSGTPALVIDRLASNFAFSPDGRRIAYQQGNTVTLANIVRGQVQTVKTAPLPGHDGSQGRTGAELVGWAGPFLVIGNRRGLDYDGYDLWDPSRGWYVPTWHRDVVGIYGASPDGRSVLGMIKSANGTCLAMFHPSGEGAASLSGLSGGDLACGQRYLTAYRHGVSPDGSRVLAASRGGVSVLVTSAAAPAAQVAAAAVQWPGEPVWVSADTFVVPQQDRILSVKVADPQHPRELPAPSTSEPWFVVSRAAG